MRMNMNEMKHDSTSPVDNSKKSILARGCDPTLSLWAKEALPPKIGNPEYVPVTNDVDFIEQLKSREWSVVYFAPGACRFSAAKRQIPGGIAETKNWTLAEYRELIHRYQGDEIQIAESIQETDSLDSLKTALENARETG